MKQTIFTLLVLFTLGFASCRKDKNYQTIKQYDQSQIDNYISANALTGMQKDTAGGDTSGIYYKVILPGSGAPLTYADNISFVFTLKSLDGQFISNDTITNHYQGYIGHITADALPYGVELAIINDLKYRGGSVRLLIPSRLAYGVNGYGSGSTKNASTHIAGNQGLDYYVHIISNQAAYDNTVIQNYLAANSLSSLYTSAPSDSGVYWHIQTQGTGKSPLTANSTIEVSYNGRLLNGTVFDAVNPSSGGVDSTSFEIPDLVKGVQIALTHHAVKGTVISMLMPSTLAYGEGAQTSIPVNSCLRYEFTIVDVTP